jgi:hypothetical protein
MAWRLIFATAVLIQILTSTVAASAQEYPNGWVSLSSFSQVSPQVLLGKTRILAYYFDRTAFKAVRFDPASGETASVDADVQGRFICLTKAGGRVAVSACSSSTRKLEPGFASVRWSDLFQENLGLAEVDRSKILLEGSNDQLLHISTYHFSLDEFLDTQKIGDDDVVATCNSLHLTSGDGVGAVNLLKTTLRPHFLAKFPAVGDGGIRTQVTSSIHLSSSAGKFICDQAITIGPGLALVVSRDQLVTIDVLSRTYSVVNLPIPRSGLLIVRAVPH